MNRNWEKILEDVLVKSVERNGGDKQLTIAHMQNIVILTNRIYVKQEEYHERLMDQLEAEAFADMHDGGGDW